MKSGRDTDKFAARHLTAVPGNKVHCPLIAESPVNIECRVTRKIPLGSHDMFLAEVVSVDIDPVYMDEKGDGNIHLLKFGEEIENDVHQELVKIFAVLTDDDSETEALNGALHKLSEIVRKMIAKSKEKEK